MAKRNNQVSIREAVDGHLLYIQAAFSPATYRDYANAHRLLLAFFDPDTPISDITVAECQRFMIHVAHSPMSPNPMTGKARAGRRKPKSVANIHVALSSLWRWATESGYAPANIMRQVPKIKVSPEPIRPLSEDGLAALLRACAVTLPWSSRPETTSGRYTAVRDRAIIAIFAECGLRVSELCGLNCDDVTLSRGGGKIYVRLGKGNKSREVFFSTRAARLIHAWMMVHPDRQPNVPFIVSLGRLQKARMTPSGIQQLLRRLGEKAGVFVTPHKLRHTAATLMAKNGATALQIQRTLGHSSIQMSMRYVELAQIDMEKAVRVFSPLDNIRN